MAGSKKMIKPIHASFKQLAKAVVSPWNKEDSKEKQTDKSETSEKKVSKATGSKKVSACKKSKV